jgi:hypothetical protein
MSQELISTWLGLEPGEWPPSHYRLLGLEQGEGNATLIEERIHQRLDRVRRYQMMYPEEATEAMNLLAQAFVCLTDPAAKKVYDSDLGLNGSTAASPNPGPATSSPPPAEDTPTAEAADENDPVVVLYSPTGETLAPPPVRVPFSEESSVAPPPVRMAYDPSAPPPPVAKLVPEAVLVEGPGPVGSHVAATTPTQLAGRRLLYRKLARVRKLQRHWGQLGKYVASAKRRLTQPAEAVEFLEQLAGIRELVADLPPLLGQAGQVGYHILTLAQLNSVPTFQSLEPEQREVLSRDWNDSNKMLAEHHAALRAQVRELRRLGPGQRAYLASARLIRKHPGIVLAALAALALVVVLFRTFVFDWLPKSH